MEYSRVFQRDFKNMMLARRSRNPAFNLSKILVPEFPELFPLDAYTAGGRLATVRGISEPYFKSLNGKTVEVVHGRSFDQRLGMLDKEGNITFRTNESGVMTTKVSVPPRSVAVYSDVNIHLPNTEERYGKQVLYQPSEGFGYIDFVEGNGKKSERYLYYIPMEAVYPYELAALVIAFSKHRAYFSGYQVALTNGYYVYMYSVPFKYRQNPGYICVGVKPDPDFSAEMNKLIAYWDSKELIFPVELSTCESDFGESINLGIVSLPGTCDAETFVPVGSALRSEEGIDRSMYDSFLYTDSGESDGSSGVSDEDVIPLF